VADTVEKQRGGRFRHRPLIGGTLSVATLTAFARLNGGLREILIAKEFGTSSALEAFLVGFGLITLIITAISGALPGALIPTYYRESTHGPHRASDLLSSVLYRFLAMLVCGSLLVALGSPVIVTVIGGGFDPSTTRLLQTVVVLLSPVIVIYGMTTLFTSLINAQEKFTIGATPQVLNPITTVIVVSLAPEPHATTLALAFLAGFSAELLATVVAALLTGLRISPTRRRATSDDFTVRHQSVDRGHFFRMFTPMAIAFGVQASSIVIDQAVASHLPQGQVAILAFGSRVTGFAMAVGITAIGTVVLPQFSQLVTSRDAEQLSESLRAKTLMAIVAGSFVAVVLSVASQPILEVVFGRGRFTSADVTAAAQVQAIAAWQVPIGLVSVLYLRVLSAVHRQRTILTVSLMAAIINSVLDVTLAHLLGVRGIVLSTTVVLGVTCIAYRQVAMTDIRHLRAKR